VPCRTGNAHVCADTKILGVDINGAFAEEVVVPVVNLWPIPDEVPSHHAAIFDPLGNAMHTCMTVPLSGKKVLITGAGPIGLMCVAMAKSLGAVSVTVTEVNPTRLAKAKDLGADFALQPQDLKAKDFDVVLELSGHPAALRQGLEVLKPTGDMVLLGIPAGEVALPLAEQVIFKGLKLHGVVGRRMYDTWYQVERFVKSNPQAVNKIISHTFPAGQFQQAFDLLEAGQANKIVLEF
jgi:threonine 3-dehydrogenase